MGENSDFRTVAACALRASPRAERGSDMNFEKYTERARGFVQSAQTCALGQGHQQFAPEHLLKVLLVESEGRAAGLIERAGGRAKDARLATEAALARMPKVSGGNGQLYLSQT